MKTDYLIIGSGLAGLTFAIKVAETSPQKKILVVTKGTLQDSNTNYAQGGVAIVQKESDSFEKHFSDTLIAGDGLCNEEIVRMVIEEGPKCLNALLNWGVHFDRNDLGDFDLGKEGGHSENRVVHYKDITGKEISRALIQRLGMLNNIKFLSHHFVIDLLTENHFETKKRCIGAFVLNENTSATFNIQSKITLLATGGIGQVFESTTNPIIATGDGIAMANRANALIKEIEFIQFHPTALYNPGESPSFLISEAVRGAGAILRTRNGKTFMQKYDLRENLASRDIVARAIDTELKNSGDKFVYLDCTQIESSILKNHFPTILAKCQSIGLDIEQEFIPVSPAAHYVCGGIDVDKDGLTSIENLFACGECSRTGLHGANRLASNSLLEAFVFAYNAAIKSSEIINRITLTDTKIEDDSTEKPILIDNSNLLEDRKILNTIMQKYAGIIRSNKGLEEAFNVIQQLDTRYEALYKNSKMPVEFFELRNLIEVSKLVVTSSQERKVNCGGFYNQDLI